MSVKSRVTERVVNHFFSGNAMKGWPDEAKQEFTELVGNLIDIYGTSGFLLGTAKKPFQDGLAQIKKKYNLV